MPKLKRKSVPDLTPLYEMFDQLEDDLDERISTGETEGELDNDYDYYFFEAAVKSVFENPADFWLKYNSACE